MGTVLTIVGMMVDIVLWFMIIVRATWSWERPMRPSYVVNFASEIILRTTKNQSRARLKLLKANGFENLTGWTDLMDEEMMNELRQAAIDSLL